MMCSNTLSGFSSRQLDLSFLGAAQFFLKAIRLVLSRCCLWLVQMLSSILAGFIFISVVWSMFFWACILAPPGPKLSFSNRFALSTVFCAVLFSCGNSMSHRYLILFIKSLPFCLSSLFICTIFNFYSFVHSPLFMI